MKFSASNRRVLLPLFICGTFVDMTRSGKTFTILGILWKVFLTVIIMHLVFIVIQFIAAGLISGTMMRKKVPQVPQPSSMAASSRS